MSARPRRIGEDGLAAGAVVSLERIRARRPSVHCITNLAATFFTPNVLLALGAVPSLSYAADEVAAFAARADALLINLGTLDEARRVAGRLAIDAARGAGRPWVLDPVFVDRSPARAAFAADLVRRAPGVVRANAAELEALAAAAGAQAATAAGFARALGPCTVMTGPVDAVSDGERTCELSGGHPLMARVTAMGCALGAVIGAFLAVEDDPFLAAAQAVLAFGAAGALAGGAAAGPGSFQPAFLDALHGLDAAGIGRAAQTAKES